MADVEALYRRVGQLLLCERERVGLSQEALAVQLGCDQSFISRIESGQRPPRLDFLLEWSEAVGVPFDQLAIEISGLWNSGHGDRRGKPAPDEMSAATSEGRR